MHDFVGALDQGTSSTRFIVFDHDGNEVARHQLEHAQILPRPGWVEHDPIEILERSQTVIRAALSNARLSGRDLAAIGLTNQRETTLVWDRRTGQPYHNAIVWQDTRNAQMMAELAGEEVIRERTGLPPATYFSGGKLRWILEHSEAARRGPAYFGTVDSWLLWNLSGRHVTDVTNAGRTMLMDLSTLAWDDELLELFRVPREILPEILPSSGHFAEVELDGTGPVQVTSVLGDQHAAMIGQVCLHPGEAKNTYGSGNFLLVNTGTEVARSKSGLISTLCYQLEGTPAVYALEGSIAVTGAAVQWLRDQIGIISTAAESEQLASAVEDTGGVYFVPAFSGLFAPYWRSDARGAIVGLTQSTTKAHLARATLEAICYQTRDILLAVQQDFGQQDFGQRDFGREDFSPQFGELKVDGGITANRLCMQMQADIVGLPVCRPVVAETTALGAAYAAGLAVGYWAGLEDLRQNWREAERWEPRWTEDHREAAYTGWKKAVAQSIG